ncbi:MAG: hypothetical protein HRT87_06115 [Legionellales bacterium]|nr:hypothetical protein [Legionellales bacterium]
MKDPSSISIVLKILSGTPTWVWVILGYLFFVGILATKQRIVYIPKLFIIPIVLFILKYKQLINSSTTIFIVYLFSLGVAIFISFKYTEKQKLLIIPEQFAVKIPGTYSTLLLLLAFFTIKYIFGFLKSKNISLYNEIKIVEFCLTGIFSGYFFGMALNHLSRYKKSSFNKIA